MAECGRAVAVLHLSGLRFLCRHCRSLAYASQREGRAERALRRGQKIRTRLGGSPFVTDPFPEKPKRMRWATYGRLIEKANEAELEQIKADTQQQRVKARAQGSAQNDSNRYRELDRVQSLLRKQDAMLRNRPAICPEIGNGLTIRDRPESRLSLHWPHG